MREEHLKRQILGAQWWREAYLVIILIALIPSARANDYYWTNLTVGDFTNAANWNGAIPGGSDNAFFTNNATYSVNWTAWTTNANAYFDAAGGTVGANIGAANTWLLTNSLVLGLTAGRSAALTVSNGTLMVTNSGGTGSLVVGQSGSGTFTLVGGTVIADKFFVTNGGAVVRNGGTVEANSIVSGFNGSGVISNIGGVYQFTSATPSITTNTVGSVILSNGWVSYRGVTNADIYKPAVSNITFLGGNNTFRLNSSTNVSVTSYTFSNNNSQLYQNLELVGAAPKWQVSGTTTVGGGGKLTVSNATGATIVGNVSLDGGVMLITSNSTVDMANNDLFVGNTVGGSQLIINQGSSLTNTTSGGVGSIILGNNSTSTSNSMLVSGPGSGYFRFTDGAPYFKIGQTSVGNTLMISNGGTVQNGSYLVVGDAAGADYNTVLVTGQGSLLTNLGTSVLLGNVGSYNRLIIEDGGKVHVQNTFTIGNSSAGTSSNNAIIISGQGSLLTYASGMTLGKYGGPFNSLTISNNGVANGSGTAIIGGGGSAFYTSYGNSALVSGYGSVWSNTGAIRVGNSTINNSLVVSNGGLVSASAIYAGYTATALSNSVLVLDGGVLQANTLQTHAALGNWISNISGVYQFTSATPTVTTNAGNPIAIKDGWINYLGVAAADINNAQVSNMTFSGNNTFRLNNSTNASVTSYVFSNNNGQLYQNLELVNGNSRWESGSLVVGSGGRLIVSNASGASVAGVFSNNAGAVTVSRSTVTFNSNVVVGGSWTSISSTNIFTNLELTAAGYLTGTGQNLWQITGDFKNGSTSSNSFDLRNDIVLLTNGGSLRHTVWGAALDSGATNGVVGQNPYTSFTDRFMIGSLTLSTNDLFLFTNTIGGNRALYVGALDIGANNLAFTNNLISSINLYYDGALLVNAYLGANIYTLSGGGQLRPYDIPEPSTLLLTAFGSICLILRARSRKGVTFRRK